MSATKTVIEGTADAAQVVVPSTDEGYRVYVGNLSFKATEEQVRELANKSGGEILSVTLPLKFKRPAGYGFVDYKTEEQAKDALEKLKDEEIEGRKVRLSLARSKEEQDVLNEKRKEAREVRKATEKEDGEKTDGAMTTDAEGVAKPKKKRAAKKTSRRRVPGEGEDGENEAEAIAAETSDTAAAADIEPKEPKKRTPKARKPRIDDEDGTPREKRAPKPRLELTDKTSDTTIFVANLPFSVDDSGLAEIFTNLSIPVKQATVVRRFRRGRGGRPYRASRGFGFVEIEDPAQQKEAVEKVEGSLIGDRKLSAKIAQEMAPIEVKEEVEDSAAEDKAAPTTAEPEAAPA